MLKPKREPTPEKVNDCFHPLAAGMLKPKQEPAPENVNARSPPPAAILKPKSEPVPPEQYFRACSSSIAADKLKRKPDPAPENIEACSSPPAPGPKPHLLYKCLLNQLAQKLKVPPPVYQTHNEGFDHHPKFRVTVCFEGTSYTSSNTFQLYKMAETDASKVAYDAILQKLKDEALQIIQEDRTFCKSIVAEYATKMHIETPKYQTIHLQTELPTFRSSVVFNGVTYTGDISKSKKEAEQLGARAVIMKILDSESANDIVEIICCKSRHFVDMYKVPEIKLVDNGTNLMGEKAGINNDIVRNENTSQASSKRNRKQKNKKKEKKKMRVDAQMPTGAVASSQGLPCWPQ